MIGRGTSVSHTNSVGARTRIQNDSLVGPWTVIEEDVLVGPRVTFVGDPTMGAKGSGCRLGRNSCRRASRIGTNAILFPPLEIGEEAVVGAGGPRARRRPATHGGGGRSGPASASRPRR